MTITHISGVPVRIGDRLIQRCSVCGTVLIDTLNEATPAQADGSFATPAAWEIDQLIQVTTGNPKSSVVLPHSDTLPEDFCLDQIERESGA